VTSDGQHLSGLEATLSVSLGRLELDAALTIGPGEVVALLGPNGAGKTTFVRALAGLESRAVGRVVLNATVLADTETGVFVAPEHRRLGVVFQHLALFEHMDITENVAFGLRATGSRKSAARDRALRWLRTVGLDDQASARPGALSGGQRQRVALARALAADPSALLLDEPLAALDVRTRLDIRRELRQHLVDTGLPALVVTHDPVDAHVLADRVVVMEAGRIVQHGTLADLGAHPRTAYVADLVGVNLVEGRLRGEVLTTPAGADVHGTRTDDDVTMGEPRPGLAAVHPRAVAIYREMPHGSPRNCWATTVVTVDSRADRSRVVLGGPLALTAEITTAALAELDLRPGDEVWAVAKATEVRLYPG